MVQGHAHLQGGSSAVAAAGAGARKSSDHRRPEEGGVSSNGKGVAARPGPPTGAQRTNAAAVVAGGVAASLRPATAAAAVIADKDRRHPLPPQPPPPPPPGARPNKAVMASVGPSTGPGADAAARGLATPGAPQQLLGEAAAPFQQHAEVAGHYVQQQAGASAEAMWAANRHYDELERSVVREMLAVQLQRPSSGHSHSHVYFQHARCVCGGG